MEYWRAAGDAEALGRRNSNATTKGAQTPSRHENARGLRSVDGHQPICCILKPHSRVLAGSDSSTKTIQPRPDAVKLIMAEPTVRERILQALEDLPPDATFDDAIERLVFLAKIDAGLAELDAGKGIPHDEAKRRLGL